MWSERDLGDSHSVAWRAGHSPCKMGSGWISYFLFDCEVVADGRRMLHFCTQSASLQLQVEALGELSKLVTNTFSEVNVYNICSGYVNNLAELQKNFTEEAESNKEFANFLEVFIHIIFVED